MNRHRFGQPRPANLRRQFDEKDRRDWLEAAVNADFLLELNPPPDKLRRKDYELVERDHRLAEATSQPMRYATEGDLLWLSGGSQPR